MVSPTDKQDGWDWGKNASASKSDANVSSDTTFTFETTWKPDGYNFKDTTWTFKLPIAISNVARDQAVYFALNDMNVNHYNIQTNYSYGSSYRGTGSDGSKEGLRYHADYTAINISFKDEYENSNRYDTADNNFTSTTGITYDANWNMSFSVKKKNDTTGADWYTMAGNAASTLSASKSYVRNSLDYMTGLTRVNYLNRAYHAKGAKSRSRSQTASLRIRAPYFTCC